MAERKDATDDTSWYALILFIVVFNLVSNDKVIIFEQPLFKIEIINYFFISTQDFF